MNLFLKCRDPVLLDRMVRSILRRNSGYAIPVNNKTRKVRIVGAFNDVIRLPSTVQVRIQGEIK